MMRDLSPSDYLALRETTGWVRYSLPQIQAALASDLFNVCIHEEVEPVAMGRVIGDGVMYFYIQDVVVHPDFQRRGLGREVMNRIEAYLSKAAPKGAFIGLMAAEGVQAFYESFGYRCRAEGAPGMFKRME